MAHGNPLNIERIIELFVKKFGIKRSLPGEFSYRAILNKKMSLLEAEGLELFFNAKNSLALQASIDLMEGGQQQYFNSLEDKYQLLQQSIEIIIDFSEDVGEERSWSLLNKHFNNFFEHLKKGLEGKLKNWTRSSFLQACLVGIPNAGKSSFFNYCLGYSRAIVSEEKGTTTRLYF